MKQEKFGFIRLDGSYLIEPVFDNAFDFSEGLALVETEGKYGYIDTTGEYVIKPQYEWASVFKDGEARVRIGDFFYNIDKYGKTLGEGFSDPLNVLRKGHLGRALSSTESKLAKENEAGEIIVYPSKSDFSCCLGRYEYWKSFESGPKFGFMDENMQIVITAKFSEVEKFSEGLTAVSNRGKWRYINTKGVYAFKGFFDDAWGFKEEVARVKFNDKWGYIDKEGKFIIKPQYKSASDFSEGLAFVRKSNRALYFYINLNNEDVFDKLFSLVRPFSDGVAFVGTKGKFGLINKEGEYIVEPVFDSCEEFKEGFAVVSIKK